ncbi:MAG: hypothetical protein GKR94_20770 [Gammaproteobacteria bacterium]|nr:hypothetical protein [Gammaproteobacteria bacterium]
MSTAIGIGFQSLGEEALSKELEAIANEYDYGVENNLDNAEGDMKSGLSELSAALDWNSIMLLKTPKDNPAALAFDIEQDLGLWECENRRPKFYDFLLSVSLLLRNHCKEFYVFFSGEWYEGDRIRMEQGYIEDLLIFLRRPANWNEKLYVAKANIHQYSDEVPLLYKVQIQG